MQPAGKFFSKLTQKAYAHHGAAWAGLLTNWSTILGDELNAISQPEKISWPRKSADEVEKVKQSRHQRLGGILTIRAAFGRALELEYQAPQIIDRINAYFGYSAIAKIRITQGKVEKPARKPKPSKPHLAPPQREQLQAELASIENEKLREALMHLAAGIKSEQKKP